MSCPYDSVCGEFFLCMHFYLWIIMLSDLSFSRGIDVFCGFCHLQVGIRCERLLDTVTVKCGHCSNLSFLSTRPLLQGQCLHHLSPLFVLVTLWTMDRGTGPSQPGDPMKFWQSGFYIYPPFFHSHPFPQSTFPFKTPFRIKKQVQINLFSKNCIL